MIGESAIIVASILLALSADAWLDSRHQAAQLDGHVAALARDQGPEFTKTLHPTTHISL